MDLKIIAVGLIGDLNKLTDKKITYIKKVLSVLGESEESILIFIKELEAEFGFTI